MIVLWMVYALAISLLLGVAALLAEKVLQWYRRPARWVWAGAMAGSILLPVAALLRPARGAAPVEGVGGAGAEGSLFVLGPIEVAAPPLSGLAVLVERMQAVLWAPELWTRFEQPLVTLWIFSSVFLIGLLTASLAWLRLRRATWKEERIDGKRVLLSSDLGPAVVGVRRPEIVLPRWVLELESRAVGMILLHEEEHLARHDTQLLAAALAAAVALPWNLPLWWHFRRLRLAVECDCDRRVLDRGVDRAAYGTLLVTIGERVRTVGLPAAALAESPSLLERRLTMLTRKIPAARRWKAAFAVAAGTAAIAFACGTPYPTEIPVEPAPRSDAAASADDIRSGPTFTPFTVRPELRNEREVQRALEAEYPPVLREAGMGGSVQIFFFISDEGEVEQVRVRESSGREELDAAALRVARTMRFSPALNRDKRVPVWISLPITFRTRTSAPIPDPRADERTSVRILPADPGDGPVFTPYTVRPEVTNASEVSEALQSEYPPMLRNAGIGGTVHVHIFINRSGEVERTLVNRTSGHEELDQAALRVAGTAKFTPALNREDPVPVWISLPITFGSR